MVRVMGVLGAFLCCVWPDLTLSSPSRLAKLEKRLAKAEKRNDVVGRAKVHFELAVVSGQAFNVAGRSDQSGIVGRPDLVRPIIKHFEAALTLHDRGTAGSVDGDTVSAAVERGKTKTLHGAFSPSDELMLFQNLAHAYYLAAESVKAAPLWKRVVRHPLCLEEVIAQAESGFMEGTCYTKYMNRLIVSLLERGRQDEAESIFEEAIALRHGGFLAAHWKAVLQIPMVMVPELRAQPFWSRPARRFKVARILEANHALIVEDFLSIPTDAWALQNDADLVIDGSWTELMLFDQGSWRNCHLAPNTCRLLHGTGELEGRPDRQDLQHFYAQVSFLQQLPGTKLRLHTGPHNARITLHLGLSIPKGAGLAVAQQKREWREGKVIAFDDSFVHEAWNLGSAARTVLYVTIWHPSVRRKADGVADASLRTEDEL